MTNAQRILHALDSRLDHEVSLVIYRRAAIALGFENRPEATTRTLDVDGIIPVSQASRFRADGNFWDALGRNPLRRPLAHGHTAR